MARRCQPSPPQCGHTKPSGHRCAANASAHASSAGRIHIDEQALELFALPATYATLTAAEFEAIVHPDDRASRCQALADAIAHATRYDTIYRITTPGGSFVVNVVGEPVRGSDGKLTGLIGVVQDVSERDRFARELIAARKAAEAASEAKSRFLATMGHELRTPLNAINGFSEIMAAETCGPLGDDAYRDYTRHILASGRHLLDLINNILDLTRLEFNAVSADVDPIDVNGLIHSVAGQMRAQAAQKQTDLAVRATLPVDLRADPRLLRQVLFNLIGNAVKFAPPATRIDVVGEVTDAGDFALRVGDAGPGIPAEDLDRVVQPFQQADDRLARRHEGLGLGLYVVRTIADGHGARLTFGRSPQGGAEVGLLFPPQRVVKT